ncbi:unnamed protein product [Peronospora destructor]|uniref:PX domain-containing protein n=1 Tax=Peronospora destructor TaxID=86335 RepID=A0AAV0USA7_9STRA|nr:unnamed protein product [Peronospora destructor]
MPSRITSTSSSADNDELNDVQQRHSLDTDLGRLSRLSVNAVKLNQIHHIKIYATYDENGDGTTIYVMNVYLRYVQKGLPPPSVLTGRVKFIDSSTVFPPRVPNRGLVASCTGWRAICTYVRKCQLERFVNQFLWAAKDISYRTGSRRCDRFLLVSEILNSFLSAASMEATENVW